MIIKVISTLILSIFILTGCTSTGSESVQNEDLIPVIVEPIKTNTINNYTNITGRVNPSSNVSVLPKTPGIVKEVLVEIGSVVNENDLLFIIDDKDISLQVAQAKAGVKIAQANLNMAIGGSRELQIAQLSSNLRVLELNLKDVEKSYDDVAKLYQSSAVPKEIYESAQNAYKSVLEQYNTAKQSLELNISKITSENLEIAKAQLAQAEAAYQIAKNSLNNTKIYAPISGVISSKNLDKGMLVSNTAPVLNIVDISEVYIDIQVLEELYMQINMGDIYEVTIPSLNNQAFNGTVVNISPNIDERTGTYLVRLSIDNSNKRLRGGMIANVSVITKTSPNTLTVPIDAVLNDGHEKIIFILQNGRAKRKVISTGITGDRYIEIFGDINESDKVIVKGQSLVNDNDRVLVIENGGE